jgi:Putative transmembrane protein (PGPGW)
MAGRLERLRERIERERERYPRRSRAFRVAWVVAALIVVAAGIAMVVFPGPAVIVIPIGLIMLSFEFAWAQRLLDKGLESGRAAQGLAERASGRQKILAGTAGACALAGAVAAAIAVVS